MLKRGSYLEGDLALLLFLKSSGATWCYVPGASKGSVRFVLAGMQDLYREWLRGELPFSLEELGRMTGDAAFEGFSTVLK